MLDRRQISPYTKKFLRYFEQVKNERLVKGTADNTNTNKDRTIENDLRRSESKNTNTDFDASVNNIIVQAMIECKAWNSCKNSHLVKLPIYCF